MLGPKVIKWSALGLLSAFLVVYAFDDLSVRIRMLHPTQNSPLESMTRTRILAIGQKNNRVEYQVDAQRPTETIVCVHSIFSHMGHPACWRIKPHFNDPIPMTVLPLALCR